MRIVFRTAAIRKIPANHNDIGLFLPDDTACLCQRITDSCEHLCIGTATIKAAAVMQI